ncbi:MAG: protein-L-isoaspartate(D-aspartate) O-methyltransferase [Candidatus Krumholzibacteria bacterium]|nr:protein-L-isoaspartate(D-aspartate) O-methyltransferase [Candidatus Krumholzibacteria bacterium]
MERKIDYSIARRRMVQEQLAARDITDRRILEAFMEVPRHLFLDEAIGARAYDDCSFPIGYSQTISQPYIQALMLQYLSINPQDRVLEIGTGSGYLTAILSLLSKEVFSVERMGALSRNAEEVLSRISTGRIRLKTGDGSNGWEFYAPFDRIIVSAAMAEGPDMLLAQLKDEGMMIAPVVSDNEHLILFRKRAGAVASERLSRCAFVPLLKGVE